MTNRVHGIKELQYTVFNNGKSGFIEKYYRLFYCATLFLFSYPQMSNSQIVKMQSWIHILVFEFFCRIN